MKHRAMIAALAVTAMVAATAFAASAQSAPGPVSSSIGSIARGGSLTLSGAEALAFAVPSDVVKVWSTRLANGTTQTRYQQMVGGASVFGGQLTVLADQSGRTTAVIGAYFPGLKAKNAAAVSAASARGIAAKRIGGDGRWTSALRIDPKDGRLFHEVVNQRFDHRWVHWVDAASGAVKKQYDAVAHGDGTGVKGDTKTSTRPGSATRSSCVRATCARRRTTRPRPACCPARS